MNGLIEVTREQFYNIVGILDVCLNSYFHTNEKRNYLDMRRESARVLTTDFKLRNHTLVGMVSKDYALPYNEQKNIYYIDKKYIK
jgi:hypothetical protein